jgi:N-acetylmuramoyl-L-alanine amidase
MTRIYRNADDHSLLAATIYAEARGEPYEGKRWVGWVIKNRKLNGNYGGHSFRGVILSPQQFECWNNEEYIEIHEGDVYEQCKEVAKNVIDSNVDPTSGCMHYNNPEKENAEWVKNVIFHRRIGEHVFYLLPRNRNQ